MRMIFDTNRGQRVPLRIWTRMITPETMRQLQRLTHEPYAVAHVAAMADAHLAAGVAVGTVFATEQTVVPSALGGDLGCGMCAVLLCRDMEIPDRQSLKSFLVTLGRALEHLRLRLASRHLGTLGGRYHFLEFDLDANGGLWRLVHSAPAAWARQWQRIMRRWQQKGE